MPKQVYVPVGSIHRRQTESMKKTCCDMVIRHPRIRPLAYDGFTVQALAIRAGRIVGIGTMRELAGLIDSNTEIVEPKGDILQPAFHDGHIHISHLNYDEHLNLSHVETGDQLRDSLKKFRKHQGKKKKWIIAAQIQPKVAFAIFEKEPELLNEVCPGKRVLIRTRDGHGGWVSAPGAQELIAKQDPESQVISINPIPRNGSAVHLTEDTYYRALEIIPGALNTPTPASLKEGVSKIIQAGVSCFHEAMVNKDDIPVWESFFDTYPAESTGRMHGMLHAMPGRWDWLRKRKPVFAQFDGRLSLGCIKVFLDGSLGSGTAWMKGDPPDHAMDVDEFLEIARYAANENFQLAVHAIGHRAVQTALDVFEKVRPRVPTPYQSFTPPWRIEHAEFVTPEDIERAAKIGVIFSVQPLHLPLDTEILLEEHADFINFAFPWADFIDAGVALVMGSDAPTTPCNPIKNLSVACGGLRRALMGIPEAPLALHALSRDVALHSHTVGGSIASLGKLGSSTLLPGQPADFVVLDGDPLRITVEKLDGLRTLQTWIHGVQAFPGENTPAEARTASG